MRFSSHAGKCPPFFHPPCERETTTTDFLPLCAPRIKMDLNARRRTIEKPADDDTVVVVVVVGDQAGGG